MTVANGGRRHARVAVALLAAAAAACRDAPDRTGSDDSPAPAPTVVRRSHRAMGSQISITAWAVDEARAVAAFEAVFAEFDRLERLLTVWRPSSDVSRINAAAGGDPVPVSRETFFVIERSIHYSRLTEGKFDICFGALSGLWRFDHDKDDRIPDRAKVVPRLKLVDYRKIELNPDTRTVRLAKEGMKIHLGGIGKGYAVDRAVILLRERGLRNFMVQAGGDLYVAGRRGDRPWRVGIRDPRGPPDRYFAAAEVTDATFSTSGDYERFFIEDGRRYHHILDPDTGAPATASRSVTVMAPDAMTADALSTGLFILGPERAVPIVESQPGVGAVFVDAHNRVVVTRRLQGGLKRLSDPSPGL